MDDRDWLYIHVYHTFSVSDRPDTGLRTDVDFSKFFLLLKMT